MITTKTIQLENEAIMDDMTDNKQETAVDEDKLAKLKERLAAKQQEVSMGSDPKRKQEKSINFGVIGSGQAGTKIAQEAFKLGYDALAINTASQDLKYIDIPESKKLLLDYSLGGAAKSLELGRDAALAYKDQITKLVNTQFSNAQMLLFTFSSGGGSGAGSAEVIIDILAGTGKPIIVITTFPMDSDDYQTKRNTMETLDKLARMAQSKKIHNLIVVDNAKIETIYHNVSQTEFFNVANKAIIGPIDVFNTYSSMPSAVKPLDSMEWAKLLIDGEGLSIYGELTVENYKEDTAIAEAVVNNLNSNLLASGFDLKQSKYVGVILLANKNVWAEIPSSAVNYSMAMINDVCGTPRGTFKGIYTSDMPENVVKVYSFFSGLGLPLSRVDQLKNDVSAHIEALKSKDEKRNLNLHLDTGMNETVSAVQKVKDKIASKSSPLGRFTQNIVQDRRK